MGLFRRSSRESQWDEEMANRRSLWGGGFSYNGVNYAGLEPGIGLNPSDNPLGSKRPHIEGDLRSIVRAAQPNSTVTAAVLTRGLVLSQIQYEYENWDSGDRKRHWHLEQFVNPKGTTMNRIHMEMEVSQSYAGNSYLWKDERRDRLKVLRPDYLSLLLGSDSSKKTVEDASKSPVEERKDAVEWALDAELVAYIYQVPNTDPIVIMPDEVVHWIAEPHPTSYWLGAAWITSCVREIASEEQADIYSDKFFQQGATPRLLHKMDPKWQPADVIKFKEIAEEETAGVFNSHKTMYIGGATDIQVVGTALGDMALTDFRAKIEQRIAVRSRVPPEILAIGAGDDNSMSGGGTYDSARKQFADLFFVPYADGLAAAMAKIAPGPPKSFLTWDPKKVLLLQQDLLDAAEVMQANAAAVSSFILAGFVPDEVIKAVASGRVKELLGKHSGRYSVQLLPFEEGESGLDANAEPIKGGTKDKELGSGNKALSKGADSADKEGDKDD